MSTRYIIVDHSKYQPGVGFFSVEHDDWDEAIEWLRDNPIKKFSLIKETRDDLTIEAKRDIRAAEIESTFINIVRRKRAG